LIFRRVLERKVLDSFSVGVERGGKGIAVEPWFRDDAGTL
jgi:hypothetical protein